MFQTAGEPNQLDVALARRMSQLPVAMERKMTPMQWTAGCSVIVAATVCSLVSSEIVNSNIAAGTHTRDRVVSGQNQNANVGKGICFTLGGKEFEWNFPNVPFGALRCSN